MTKNNWWPKEATAASENVSKPTVSSDEERLALARKRWAKSFRIRATAMRAALSLTGEVDHPTPHTIDD